MDNIFLKRLSSLISVKSIVTITTTIVFAILALTDRVSTQDFMSVFTMLVAFYFGTQSSKLQDALDNKDHQKGD